MWIHIVIFRYEFINIWIHIWISYNQFMICYKQTVANTMPGNIGLANSRIKDYKCLEIVRSTIHSPISIHGVILSLLKYMNFHMNYVCHSEMKVWMKFYVSVTVGVLVHFECKKLMTQKSLILKQLSHWIHNTFSIFLQGNFTSCFSSPSCQSCH